MPETAGRWPPRRRGSVSYLQPLGCKLAWQATVARLKTATTWEDADVGHHLPHVDLARRLRRRAGPEPGESAGEARQGVTYLAPRRRARKRRRHDRGRLAHETAWGLHHGPQHVRADPRRVG